jgi:hypothetical protein
VATLASNQAVDYAPKGLQEEKAAFVPGMENEVFDLVGSGMTLSWNGKTDGGQYVDSGYYICKLTVHDPLFGSDLSYSRTIAVIKTAGLVKVQVFNSAGELVWSMDAGLSQGALASSLFSSGSYMPSSGNMLNICYGEAPANCVAWDGTNSIGEKVSSGTYVVLVTGKDASGKATSVSQAIQLLTPPSHGLDQAVAVPNPVGVGQGRVTVWLTGFGSMAAAGRTTGVVYGLSGERVKALSNEGHPESLVWDLPHGALASGIYLIHLKRVDNDGTVSMRTLKVVLER